MVNSFTVYKEYYELITLLKEEERRKICWAIWEYMFDDVDPVLNKNQMKVFNNLKRPLDKSKIKSQNSSKQNENELKTDKKQNKNEIDSVEHQNKKKVKTHQDVNVNVNVDVRNKKFIKPSIEEIESYCKERNNNIDANAFYDFYESKGWKVGNQPMKNWKACIRTWENRNKKSEADVPDWFNTEIKQKEMEKSEEEEIQNLIKKYETK